MASSKAPCVTCGNKGAGIFRCEGCLQVFCRKHMNEHRDALSRQLDEIVLGHDSIQQVIADSRRTQNKQHPVLKQIEQWEPDAIEKIRRLAEELRQQMIELPGTQQLSKNLRGLAERLQAARTDDDYIETDLRTWKTMLQEMQNDINSFSTAIRLEESSREVLVAKVSLSTNKLPGTATEKFAETCGDIQITENGLLATKCGPEDSTAYVRAAGAYSSGTQKIRFLFQKHSSTFIAMFGIVSKLIPFSTRNSRFMSQFYGWGSDDSISPIYDDAQDRGNTRDMRGQTSFEIELELDCDNRTISYINQRTKCRRELNVDVTNCPFPWQVCFYLFERGDCVRLLP